MSTTNVFYVTSPFQYLCAFEARLHLKSQHNILIIEEGDTEKGLKQLEELVNRDCWDKIFRIGTQNRTVESPKLIKALKLYVSTEQLQIDHICYGEFTSWRANLLLKNLDHQAPLYFDDGTLSLVEFERHIRPQKPYSRQRWLQDLMLRIQGIRPIKNEAINDKLIVFSIFNFDDSPFCYIKNQFDDLLARFDKHEIFDESAPVGFIGQGAVGDKYQKSIDEYLKEIKSALQCTSTGSMIYFPHRTEKPTVKEKVQAIEGITYYEQTHPFEIEVLTNKIQLSSIVSPYSTVLFTLRALSPKLPIRFIEPSTPDEISDIIYKALLKVNAERLL